jgi:hypothetical protein
MCQVVPFVRWFQSSSCYRFLPQCSQHTDFSHVFKVPTPKRKSFLTRFRTNQLEHKFGFFDGIRMCAVVFTRKYNIYHFTLWKFSTDLDDISYGGKFILKPVPEENLILVKIGSVGLKKGHFFYRRTKQGSFIAYIASCAKTCHKRCGDQNRDTRNAMGESIYIFKEMNDLWNNYVT